jgi:hypothetical protein
MKKNAFLLQLNNPTTKIIKVVQRLSNYTIHMEVEGVKQTYDCTPRMYREHLNTIIHKS